MKTKIKMKIMKNKKNKNIYYFIYYLLNKK